MMTARHAHGYLTACWIVALTALLALPNRHAVAQPIAVSGGGELQPLTDALVFQLKLTHRGNKLEHQRRRRALAAATAAWTESSRSPQDRAQFEAWLRSAIRASMPGSSRPMPKVPRFAATAAPVPPAAAHATTLPGVTSANQPSNPATIVSLPPAPAASHQQPEAFVAEPAVETPAIETTVAKPPVDNSLADDDLFDDESLFGEQDEFDSGAPEPKNPEGERSAINRLWAASPAKTPLAFPASKTEQKPAAEADSKHDQDELDSFDLFDFDQPPAAETKVTANRPPSLSSEPTGDININSDELRSRVSSYNDQVQAISKQLQTTPSPTAFLLNRWAQELERLEEQKQFTEIYLVGAGDRQRSPELVFTPVRDVIRTLQERLSTRQELISDLPAQAVRAEATALDNAGRTLRLLQQNSR